MACLQTLRNNGVIVVPGIVAMVDDNVPTAVAANASYAGGNGAVPSLRTSR